MLVSACLMGETVRYNGVAIACRHPLLMAWQDEGRVVRFCPEVAGGLPVPRSPSEIVGGGGEKVVAGGGRVLSRDGRDVSEAFLSGSRKALEIVRRTGIRMAIMKDGSPSCGCTRIYDGSFSGVKISGQGVTAALLISAGVRVFTENQIGEAAACLARLEARG